MMSSVRVGSAPGPLGKAPLPTVQRPRPEPPRPVPPDGGPEPVSRRVGGDLPLRLLLPDPGFLAHLIVAADAGEAPSPAAVTGLDAYRLRLNARISYSGPVRPVDLRL